MLAWIDLEMTGLDPSRHAIVEIACLITDDDLAIVAEGPDMIVHASTEQLAEMDEFVTAMHTRSGLLSAVVASTLSLEEAGAMTLSFLKQHIAEPATVPLAGNSIGTDRRFLAAYLPEVEDFLNYRSVDVSTIKELCRRWYPGVYRDAPTKAGGHRALQDIRESVAELAYYRTALFNPAPPSDRASEPVSGPDREPVDDPASKRAHGPAGELPSKPATQSAGERVATTPSELDAP